MGHLGSSLDRIRSGFGLKVDETMAGEHEFEHGFGPAGRRPMEFSVTWGPDNVLAWLRDGGERWVRHPLRGTVTVDGLCERAECEGNLELLYLDERKIRYAFEFSARGHRFRYVGEKVNIRAWNLPVSHTTCYGRITETETGRLVSTSVTYFKLRETLHLLGSLRLEQAAG